MRPSEVRIGQIVTVRVAIPARYSGYGGNPVQDLTPGTVAIVASVRVPKVRIVPGPASDARDEFVNVTFVGDNGAPWDAAVNYCNLIEVAQ